MKRVFFLVSIMLFIVSCGQGAFIDSNVNETEVINQVKRKYEGPIDEINVGGLLEVEVIKSDQEYVLIEGADKAIKSVKVKLNNGKLQVNRNFNNLVSNLFSNNDGRVRVKIYLNDFTSIVASSSAEVEFLDKFTQDKLNISTTSSANIKGYLEANNIHMIATSSGEYEGRIWAVNLSVRVNSSGEIKVKGKAKNAEINASSSGELEGKDLEIRYADLSASSSGEIAVKVSEEVSARASSIGGIKIYHHRNLTKQNISESSGGTVKFKTL